jgi:hypothetical protein
MWEFLEALENSSLAIWVRESPSVLAYSTVLALHTFGMSFLVGFSTMIALRVLGFASGLPLAPMKKFFVLIVTGFWVNAITGVVLVILAPREFLTNADFYVKLAAIAGAVVSLRSLRAAVFGREANPNAAFTTANAKVSASAMLVCWGVAITAGRLTAYSGPIVRWTVVAVIVFTVLALVVGRLGARLLHSYRPARKTRVMASTGYSQNEF